MKITTPIKLHDIEIQNRLVMPPMASSHTPDGRVTDELTAYYQDKTKSGAIGLVITEHAYVSPEGIAHPAQLSVSRDTDVEGLKALASVIHQNGSRAVAQINHAGGQAAAPSPVSASPFLNGRGVRVRAMRPDEIERTVKDFADAALRVKEAGFDGVEIHSAHGYLLDQFYSPLVNQREDEYGPQSMENRTRFHREVLKAVRDAVGKDFLVGIRLGGSDYQPGGATVEDAALAAKIFEENGADYISLTGGMNGYIRPGHTEAGYFKDQAEAVKKVSDLPVILTGGVKSVEDAEALLEEGASDLIGAGRAILRDSMWPEGIKRLSGQTSEEKRG